MKRTLRTGSTMLALVLACAVVETGAAPSPVSLPPEAIYTDWWGGRNTTATDPNTGAWYRSGAAQTDELDPSAYYIGIVRHLPDGSIDLSFNRTGAAVVPIWGVDVATRMIVRPSGELLILAGAHDLTDAPDCSVTRTCSTLVAFLQLRPDGTFDPNFGMGGRIVLRVNDAVPAVSGHSVADISDWALQLREDGGLVLWAERPHPVTPDLRVSQQAAQLTRDGRIDTGFDQPGVKIGVVAAAPLVEYYHQGLDHFFYTSDGAEMSALDFALLPGWRRTQHAFWTLPVARTSGADVPVCRFYRPPSALAPDTHFFTIDAAECASLQTPGSGWVLESQEAFHVASPDRATGACPEDTQPVLRLWNRRADTNHRFTTSAKARAQMEARGWLSEGYGAEGVAMCAARSPGQ